MFIIFSVDYQSLRVSCQEFYDHEGDILFGKGLYIHSCTRKTLPVRMLQRIR